MSTLPKPSSVVQHEISGKMSSVAVNIYLARRPRGHMCPHSNELKAAHRVGLILRSHRKSPTRLDFEVACQEQQGTKYDRRIAKKID